MRAGVFRRSSIRPQPADHLDDLGRLPTPKDADAENLYGGPQHYCGKEDQHHHRADDIEHGRIGRGAVHHDERSVNGNPGKDGGDRSIRIFRDEHHREQWHHHQHGDHTHVILSFLERVTDTANRQNNSRVKEIPKHKVNNKGTQQVRSLQERNELRRQFRLLPTRFPGKNTEERTKPGDHHRETNCRYPGQFPEYKFSGRHRGQQNFNDTIRLLFDGVGEQHLADREQGYPKVFAEVENTRVQIVELNPKKEQGQERVGKAEMLAQWALSVRR